MFEVNITYRTEEALFTKPLPSENDEQHAHSSTRLFFYISHFCFDGVSNSLHL